MHRRTMRERPYPWMDVMGEDEPKWLQERTWQKKKSSVAGEGAFDASSEHVNARRDNGNH